MSNKSDSKSDGASFFSLLTLIFITLKLTNYIDWSWFWVLSPVLVPISILIAIVLLEGLVKIFK